MRERDKSVENVNFYVGVKTKNDTNNVERYDIELLNYRVNRDNLLPIKILAYRLYIV